jgi:hypothetical protein
LKNALRFDTDAVGGVLQDLEPLMADLHHRIATAEAE